MTPADPPVPSRLRRALGSRLVRKALPPIVTLAVFAIIFRRVPLALLGDALREADHARFLALMVPNALAFFCWDTLVLATAIRWFHGPIRYAELLPARAVSYVVALFNTNLARGALAGYLARRLHQPFLQLGSTVIFLVLTEYTHLVGWAALGLLAAAPELSGELAAAAVLVAVTWLFFLLYTRFNIRPWEAPRVLVAWRSSSPPRGGPREWALLRTFRIAPLRRYGQTIALRAPMFFASLCFHYFAAGAFGIHIPFGQLVAFLPVIFMIAALPITVAHLGTTQAAWIFFFGAWAPEPRLLAFSLAAHVTFTATRAVAGLVFTPRAYAELVRPSPARALA
jgi:hypothetical protein